MYVRRSLDHPQRRRFAEITAARCGVSVERLIEVVQARKRFQRARYFRQRGRRRYVEKSGTKAAARPREGKVYAGEGEFHELLKEAGLTEQKFAEMAGYTLSTVKGWKGHPLHHLPCQFLRHYIWANNMARVLGAAAEQHKPKGVPRTKEGQYPRTEAQAEKVVADAADMIMCPAHGLQKAMGGECPKC